MKNLFRKIRTALIHLVDRIAEADRFAVENGLYEDYSRDIVLC